MGARENAEAGKKVMAVIRSAVGHGLAVLQGLTAARIDGVGWLSLAGGCGTKDCKNVMVLQPN